ncbi:helix-hairpin-helix domain-containing protein [Chitinophaga sp. GCM10012297]|uniref:Helix-hairpin-helix domain-containing protein n=1 Tax=Chitinophaga chungangae TaxID=2821488 RepID=A0ABS3YJM1_9BACT|nr:helix-hairpin-helix domain-containing protein [Chitinophaga chungangae]MBO9154892.1 helix-hairpin-helix domain-containing protein [Chitinophaga chungangae]
MGKRMMFVVALFFCTVKALAQEEELPMEMRQEQGAGREMERTGEEQMPAQENDEQYQELAGYARRKLNLNTADAAALHGLGLMDALQVNALLQYRETLGALVSIYELQAVPGFELPLIRLLLPYVQAGSGLEPYYTLKDYVRRGKHQLELRYGRTLEAAEGYRRGKDEAVRYLGSADKILLRYRYRFGKYASWGLVMEKDAGETWMRKGAPWLGDHLGFHLFLQRMGKVKALALGDFTVNIGQGLIQWQGFSFGKSAAVMQVKRESEVLRPYAAAGEFYFYRGAGVTVEKRNIGVTGFMSIRRLDGRLHLREDTPGAEIPGDMGGEVYEEGTLSSAGYHRTPSEMTLRANMLQYTAGAVAKWKARRGHLAFNAIAQQYAHPLKKGEELYRLYALEGKRVLNASADHSFSWRNVHWFGETAVDGSGHPALLQGFLAALGTRADVVLLYRYEHKAYRSMYGNSFGESSAVGNENGMYAGLQLKWGSKWLLAAYADVFQAPWLKYRVSAPSGGTDALLFLQWLPDKKSSLNITYRYASSPVDVKVPPLKQRIVMNEQKHLVSMRATLPVNDRITWQGRMQAAFGNGAESFMLYQQVQARLGKWRLGGGYSWFDTAETEGLYLASMGFPGDQSLARFSGRGYNGHAQVQYRVSEGLSLWCRWQQAVYPGSGSIGSGLEEIEGERKTGVLLQVQFSW